MVVSLLSNDETGASIMTRLAPDLPCSTLFSEAEWKAALAATIKSLVLPEIEPTAHEVLIMIACLGGYLNRKHDPLPGATVIWRGLTYLKGFTDALELISGVTDSEPEVLFKNTYG